MRVMSVLFWIGWLISVVLTGLLFLWHRPIYPFTKPGTTMNEAGAFFLLVMLARWTLIAGLVALIGVLLAARFRAPVWVAVVLPILLVLVHGAIGFVNLGIWNAWVSVIGEHTLRRDWALAISFFAIPALVLLVLGIAKLVLPTDKAPPPLPQWVTSS